MSQISHVMADFQEIPVSSSVLEFVQGVICHTFLFSTNFSSLRIYYFDPFWQGGVGCHERQKIAPKSKLVPRVPRSSHCHSVLLMQTRIVVVICFWQQEYHAEKIAKRNARANLPERHEKLEEFVKHFSCYFRMAKSCRAALKK